MEYLISPANNHIYSKKFNLPNKDPSNTPRPKNYTPKLISIAHPSAIINSAKRAPINIKLIPYLDSYNVRTLYPKGFKYNIGELFTKEKSVKTPKSIYHPLIKSNSCFNYFPLKRKDKKRTSCPGNYKHNKIEIKVGNHIISFGKEDKNKTENKISLDPKVNIHKDFISKGGKKISSLKKFKFLEEIIEEDSNQYNHTDLKFYQKKSPSTTIGKNKIFGFLSPKENQQIPYIKDFDNRIKSIPILRRKEPRNRIQTAKRRFLIGSGGSIPGQRKFNITGKELSHNTIGKKTKITKNLLIPFDPNKYIFKRTNIFRNNLRTLKMGTEPKIKSSNSYKNISGSKPITINICRNFMSKFKYDKQKRGKLTIINFPES